MKITITWDDEEGEAVADASDIKALRRAIKRDMGSAIMTLDLLADANAITHRLYQELLAEFQGGDPKKLIAPKVVDFKARRK